MACETPWTGSAVPPSTSEVTQSEVRVGSVSSLQPLFGSVGELGTTTSWCMAIRLVKVTTTESAVDPDSPPTTTTTACGQISVLLVDIDDSTNAMSCWRVAMLNDAEPDASAAVELSQDARFLSLSSAAQGISLLRVPDIDQWKQQSVDVADPGAAGDGNDGTDRDKTADEGGSRLIPPIDMSSTPRLALSETIPGSLNDEAERPPLLHFLVAPVTTGVASNNSKPFANAPITFALVACVGNRVLKFLLPDDPSCQSIAPLIRWEHLSHISASSVDASTELLVVACADGSLVVWNVLRDRDHSFMSTRTSTTSPSSVIDAVLYRKGVVVALSTASQRVWFFDARKRRAPTLLRVVTPPPSSSLSAPQLSSAQPPSAATTIAALVASTSELGIPVAILQYSTGLAVLYDMRSARAIGSVRTSSPLLSVNTNALCGVGRMASDQKQAEAFDIYTWDQLVPTGFDDAGDEYLGTAHASHRQVDDDPLALVYRLAGKSKPPPSPSSPKLKSPLLPSQATPSTPSHLERAGHKSAADSPLALQPLVPDWGARFRQFCDERLDPQSMAERDAVLMRRQRAILKAVAATASS